MDADISGHGKSFRCSVWVNFTKRLRDELILSIVLELQRLSFKKQQNILHGDQSELPHGPAAPLGRSSVLCIYSTKFSTVLHFPFVKNEAHSTL